MADFVPVALFVYNRPTHTAKTLEFLQKNEGASQTKLIIYSDGLNSNRPQDLDGILKVRKLIREISGFKEVEIIEREKNLGLARSIIGGVTECLERYGKIIVLEDDLLTSPYFLRFMNDALRIYEDEKKVFHIQGYMYPHSERLPDAVFTRDPGSWGWATWKDRWQWFEPDSHKLLTQIKDTYSFDFDGSYSFLKMLKMQAQGKVNSWAIRWYASLFVHGKLALWPGESLVLNIGFDESGVHCEETTDFTGTLKATPVVEFPTLIEENAQARAAIIRFFRRIKPSLQTRLVRRLRRIFPKSFREKSWVNAQSGGKT